MKGGKLNNRSNIQDQKKEKVELEPVLRAKDFQESRN